MGFEFQNVAAPSEKGKEILDDEWYERFREVGAFQDFEYLTGNKEFREDQKNKFLYPGPSPWNCGTCRN